MCQVSIWDESVETWAWDTGAAMLFHQHHVVRRPRFLSSSHPNSCLRSAFHSTEPTKPRIGNERTQTFCVPLSKYATAGKTNSAGNNLHSCGRLHRGCRRQQFSSPPSARVSLPRSCPSLCSTLLPPLVPTSRPLPRHRASRGQAQKGAAIARRKSSGRASHTFS